MISPKYLDGEQFDRVLLGIDSLSQGLYFTKFKEQEDSGWIDYTSYRYYKEGIRHPVWTIDFSGGSIFFYILKGKSFSQFTEKEEFLDHVIEVSPEVMDWVLFNLGGS